jgi:tetratricopeptide (TPR) repeat protein
MLMNARHGIAAVTVTLLSLATAHAADYGQPAAAPAAATTAEPLAAARTLIGQAKWREAIDELKRVNQASNADWNNLMGYTHRKQATPDLAAAQRYYEAALRIDPKHRGALEYAGELMLMKNDLPGAKAKLSSLEAVCGAGCAETEKLKTAIASFEAGKPRTQ